MLGDGSFAADERLDVDRDVDIVLTLGSVTPLLNPIIRQSVSRVKFISMTSLAIFIYIFYTFLILCSKRQSRSVQYSSGRDRDNAVVVGCCRFILLLVGEGHNMKEIFKLGKVLGNNEEKRRNGNHIKKNLVIHIYTDAMGNCMLRYFYLILHLFAFNRPLKRLKRRTTANKGG